ncbi:MAG: nucleoside hydrolase [Alistipes sp.]|nr:nucleoside hydrolase [Alistipes sp.]
MKKLFLLLVMVGLCATTFAQSRQKAQSIIFETDMGNDIDDAMALDILFKYVDMGKINLLGVGVHKNNPHSAEFIDIMRTWYGHKKTAIGVNTACVTDMNCVDYCTKTCQMKNKNGEPMFARSKNPKYEEAVEMYRRLLAKQPDKSVVIVTVGFSTTIAELLKSGPDKYSKLSGMELVKQKVEFFSIMAGEFAIKDFAEYNVWNDLEAARHFFENSPVPMVYTPWILGDQIQYPGESIENDFGWAPEHPMVEAYKAYNQMPYDRPTWDVIAAYYACDPTLPVFQLGEAGDIKVEGKGITKLTPNANGLSRVLVPNETQRKQILDSFIKLLTTKPKNKK